MPHRDHLIEETIRRLTAYGVRDLADDVAVAHDTSVEKICGRLVHRNVSAARHHLWAEIHARPGWSYRLIGELFRRDPTTVCDGVDAHLNRMELAARGRAA